ncbi:MAG: RNB domain-containing ribonuclease [Spirochaetaceae bacterium]|nr:RNB domain-containing ribonuclease [Spirochaetaceae bacterium]
MGDKITIQTGGEEVRARLKDIELLHEGPVASLACLDEESPQVNIREVWELCLDEYGATGKGITLRELAELAYGVFSPQTAWAAYKLLFDGIYFNGSMSAIQPRSEADVKSAEQRLNEKQMDSAKRAAFIARLRSGKIDIEADSPYMQDIAALALGKALKSRSLREAGIDETQLAAHRLLLQTGYWKPSLNPNPSRFGVSLIPALTAVPPPPPEERADLTALPAFAIDNEWSDDPDDAVFFEPDGGGGVLYVHVADPAASIRDGTAADKEAFARGVTFYAPEGVSRMISAEAFPFYALGLSETSPALTFKIRLDQNCSILDVEIFSSTVRVTRLSYEKADDDPRILPLIALSGRNLEKRLDLGAALIEFPETRVLVDDDCRVEIIPQKNYKSAAAVRECMLLAGEAAARWALERGLPFPYITQETGDIPNVIYEGLAGSYQLRRCMRPRNLSTKPGLHWGLGLDIYSQVTSPLRRCADLLAHQQIRAAIHGEIPLDKDALLLKLGAAERATLAVTRAERATTLHWKLVYLLDKLDTVWDAVLLEKSGPRAAFFIPELGMETSCALDRGSKDTPLNGLVKLRLKSVKIPEYSANFVSA